MANNNQQTLSQKVAQPGLLDLLLQRTGQAIQTGIEAGGRALSTPQGQQVLAALLKSIPGATQIAQLQQGRQQTGQLQGQVKQNIEDSLDPVRQEQLKEIKKIGKEQVREAAPFVSLDDMQRQILAGSQQVFTPPATENQVNNKQNIGTDLTGKQQGFDLSNFLISPAVNAEGVPQRRRLLGGLLAESPGVFKARLENKLLQQDITGEKALIKLSNQATLENFKQDRLDQREIIKAELKRKTNAGEGITIGEVSDNISDFIQTWDSIATGPFRGNLTALFSKLGKGSAKLSTLKSMSDIMVFTLGGFFTGQTGRAFSDRDRQIIGDALKISVRTKAQDVIGKLNSAINFTNAKVRAEGGINFLPDATTMIERVRQGLNPVGSGQAQPGTQSATKIGRFNVEVE